MIVTGDAREVLPTLPDASVHCCITSPPYWGLRDYGVPEQLGLEPTPEEYVAKIVAVFGEVRRVLRDDGTCWVNLGDSYASSSTYNTTNTLHTAHGWRQDGDRRPNIYNAPGLKPKDLVGIPWRVAFALQADGWYLRSDIIWSKPNPMPESVTDRPTKAHEYLFLLSKQSRYFYDAEAIAEQAVARDWGDYDGGPQKLADGSDGNSGRNYRNGGMPSGWNTGPGGHGAIDGRYPKVYRDEAPRFARNRRTVWTIATQPFPEAHFATFPEKLVEPCVLAGAAAKVCAECGAPWERVIERGELVPVRGNYLGPIENHKMDGTAEVVYKAGRAMVRTDEGWSLLKREQTTLGFRPTCTHDAGTVPASVLDPFCGSGTVGAVAGRLGREFVGIELNPDYVAMAERRIYEATKQMRLEVD